MREFTVVIFDQHRGKHDLNKKSNWTEWRAPFLFKMRSHAGYKLQQKTDTYHIIHADCFVCIFRPPTRIRRFLKRHKFFYTNLPSVHTKPVSPLTQTASFWNRSYRLKFLFWSDGYAEPWRRLNADIIDFAIQWSGDRPFNRECWANFGCDIFSLSNNLVRHTCLAGHKTTGAGWVEVQLFNKIARQSWSPHK